LAGFGSGGSGSFRGSSNVSLPEPSAQPGASVSFGQIGKVLGDSTENLMAGLPVGLIVTGIVVGLIVLAVIVYLSTCANAGLIVAVDKIESTGEKIGFKKSFAEGSRYFWRLFGLALIVLLVVFGGIVIVSVPLMVLMIMEGNKALAMIPVTIIVGLVVLVAVIYLSLLMQLVLRLIVLGNKKILASIREAHSIFKRNWKNYLLGLLVIFGIGLAVSLVFMIAILVAAGILFAIGFGLYKILGLISAVVFAVVASVALLVVLVVARGILTAFQSTYWTLFYRGIIWLENNKI